MPQEDITFYLSLWGATLATILALIQVVTFFRSGRRLRVLAYTQTPFDCLHIEVWNVGSRPVSLRSVSVSYGGYRVMTLKRDLPRKLSESDSWMIHVPRAEIIEARKKSGLRQREYCRVRVVAEGTAYERFQAVADIPHGIINKGYSSSAADYIAADLFVGFEQMKSW